MKLCKVLLGVDYKLQNKLLRDRLQKNFASQFEYQARSAGHFVGTRLAEHKIDTDFRQLVFAVTDQENRPEFESYRPQSLLVHVPFELSAYQSACALGESNLNAYFCELLKSGFRKTAGLNPRIAELGLAYTL